MAVEGGGPNIIDDGLVFALDAANIRSYPGNATTNLSYNNGQGNSEYLANSVAWTNSGTWTLNTNNTSIDKPTILDIPNLPTLPTTLRVISGVTDSVGSQHHGGAWTNISPSTTYTMSVWFRQNRAGSSGPYLRTNVNNNQIGTFSYNGSTNTSNWPVNTWIRITATGTTQANENAIYLSNYIGGQVGDAVYYYGHQTEVGSTATPLVAGTRSAAWNSLVGGIGGTPTNGPTYNSDNGGSIVFDGSNDYVIGATTLNINNSVTMEAWIYPTSAPSGGGGGGFIISNIAYYFELKSTRVVRSYFYGLSSPGYHDGTVAVSLNTWSHIVAVRNSSDNTIKHYINGTLDNTISGVTGIINNGGQNYQVGGYQGGSYSFTGRIATCRVYNTALSASEVLQNFNAQRKRFGV